jgi:hypothetical protein
MKMTELGMVRLPFSDSGTATILDKPQENTGRQQRLYARATALVSEFVARPFDLWRWTASNSTIADNYAKLEWLRDFYTFTDSNEIAEFLEYHPECIKVLREAIPHLERYFGAFPQVILEIVSDPEIENFVQLIANIKTPLEVEQALSQLRKFDRAWFLGQPYRVRAILNFNLEFV